MPDYAAPPEDQALELGPRQPLYAAFYLALLVAWVPTKVRAVASWLSRGPRPRPPRPPVPVADGRGPVRGIGIPPRRILSLVELELDPAQVAAVTAALVGAFSIVQRRADASASESESDSDSDSHASGHHSDVHHRYPPIHSLEAGDGRLFLPASDPRRQGDRLCRLSDVQENPWIITASTERFADPCELTDETTRTWVMRLKTTTKLVCLSKQQLHEQNQELAEERFAVVSEQSLELILEVACSFCDARWSRVHILQQLTVFDALVDVLFNIKDLHFSRSGEVAGIINKMVNAFKGVIQRTSNDIRGSKESTIHPATLVLVQVLEFFWRNGDMVQSILESGDYNTGPCSDMLDCLVSKLKECSEMIFQEKGQRASRATLKNTGLRS
ncbi:hypothetical protein CFC21_102926 [Triticum aestivum]|uniref:Exocyst subunit Exo70 family protein n=2 Tax=Triticum aestivum TaxID=4565 RepID=A0A9R1M6Q3_WHEAT|nr:uncharacterized protein LOC123043214 isoform X2 [Triticum aestivum]KAF7101661.1 hypothetical protein CFC21_102926 [Triticum aestivum]